jgi:hypothetical protein
MVAIEAPLLPWVNERGRSSLPGKVRSAAWLAGAVSQAWVLARCVGAYVRTGPPTHGVSVGAARTHGTPTQAVGPRHTRPHV